MPRNNQLAVLMGNGVSIAANPDLQIPRLTDEIRARFETVDPKHEAPDRVLARLAGRGGDTGDPHQDFEALLGPLDQQGDNLHDLRELSELVGTESQAVRRAIATVDTFVSSLRRLGRGHALDIIANRSVANYERRAVVVSFIDAILDAVTGPITIGNLNYDSLAMAALVGSDSDGHTHRQDVCDMADPRGETTIDVLGTGFASRAMPLRTSLGQFPSFRRVRLVHPHGSLTWLKHPHTNAVYKFEIDDLRHQDLWAQWRDGATDWEPQVVLTNQTAKSGVVEQPPFKLAYDVLYERLLTADRWLIAGYSFRDECVNDLLAQAWTSRRDVPDVLVVTYGRDLRKAEVLDAIGYNPDVDPEDTDAYLHVCRHGVADAPTCATWRAWSSPLVKAA